MNPVDFVGIKRCHSCQYKSTKALNQWLNDAASENGFAAPYLLGDANFDGTVNMSDLNVVGLSWLQELAPWSAGDFNADGTVNAGDLNKIGLNWLTEIPKAASQTAAVPEPAAAALAVFALAAVTWLRRRTLGT